MKELSNARTRIGFDSVRVVVFSCRLHGNWGEPGIILLKKIGSAQLNNMLISFK